MTEKTERCWRDVLNYIRKPLQLPELPKGVSVSLKGWDVEVAVVGTDMCFRLTDYPWDGTWDDLDIWHERKLKMVRARALYHHGVDVDVDAASKFLAILALNAAKNFDQAEES